MRTLLLTFAIFHLPFSIFLSGCDRTPPGEKIVLYTSVDEPIARPIIQEFEKQSGIQVVLVTDAEATKSVGLAERLRAEKGNPQADVFWGNEPFHTINLAEEGLLQPYESHSAKDVPNLFKDPGHRWAGNGLRARVIARFAGPNTPPPPLGLPDLAEPGFNMPIAMARPTVGTTGGHVASLYILWGEAQARKFFKQLHDNKVVLLGGNSVVAQSVAAGHPMFGLTDNDDVAAAQANGGEIEMLLPNQGNSFGTLMIPTTAGLVTGTQHADAGKKLIDYLLSQGVEKKLIEAKFAGWSVRNLSDSGVKPMQIDYREVARIMPRVVREATAILEGRE